jgi:hypothetical protein
VPCGNLVDPEELAMRLCLLPAFLGAVALVGLAVPAQAAGKQPLYYLFVNASSGPFTVKDMTIGGSACSVCKAQDLAPGATALVRIGDLAGKHLKMMLHSVGSADRSYDTDGHGTTMSGAAGPKTNIVFASRVTSSMIFDETGTPLFTVIYAYDKPKKH